jgi:hypothetical protein
MSEAFTLVLVLLPQESFTDTLLREFPDLGPP